MGDIVTTQGWWKISKPDSENWVISNVIQIFLWLIWSLVSYAILKRKLRGV